MPGICTLHILDEVNCKFEGLDADTRKKLVNKFKYEIPGSRYIPAVRLGRWDGKVAYFQVGGSTYINLLPEIIPILEQERYEIEINDARDYAWDLTFEKVREDSYSHIMWPKKHTLEGKPIMLRDYQVDVINNFLENPQCLQEISTGAGKTIITAVLSHRVEKYGRTIVIVPNKSLVTQTEADYINLGLDVGVYFGERREYNKTHTICTWQSLNNMLKNTRAKSADVTIHEFLEGVVCVMVDECHSAKADALKTLLTGVMSQLPIRWGLTGTIPKEDFEFKSLLVSLGNVIGRLSASELQEQGVLASCHVNIVQLRDHVEFPGYQQELKYLVATPERLAYIGKFIEKVSQTGNTLILVDRVTAGEYLETVIPGSVFVSGVTKAKDRKDHYDDVADATGKILICTYGVAAVGINIPRLFNVIMIEPGKSFVRVIQSIGRGLRKARDKDFVNIYDITSTCKFSKRHLQKRKLLYKEASYPMTIEQVDWS